MKHAFIGDVHANADALRAALTDARDLGAERIWSLGDVVGYGPDPVETLALVHRDVHVCLLGNHDAAVCGRCGVEDFSEFAAAAVRRHRALLAPDARDWLRSLPYVAATPDFACVHGDFSDPARFDYVLDADDAVPSWRARPEQLLFVGHTHEPGVFVVGKSGRPYALEPLDFVLEPHKRYLVNPGSVGYPRDGACRSSYVLFDDVARTVEFRFLPFDLDSYRRKMAALGVSEPAWLAERARARQRPALRAPFAEKTKTAKVTATTKTTSRTWRTCAWAALPFAFALAVLAAWHGTRDREGRAPSRPTEAAPKIQSPKSIVHSPQTETLLATRTFALPPDMRSVWAQVASAPGSESADVHVSFFDAAGEEIGEGTVRQTMKRRFTRRCKVPPGAVRATLNVTASRPGAAVVLERCHLGFEKREPDKQRKTK